MTPAADETLVEAVARAIEPGPWNLRDFGIRLDEFHEAGRTMSLSRARDAIAAVRRHDASADLPRARPVPPPARVLLQGGSLVPNWLRRCLGWQEVGVFYAKPYRKGAKPLSALERGEAR